MALWSALSPLCVQKRMLIPEYDPSMNVWLVPFPMAPINTKNVHRTNFLLGHPDGTDFVYDDARQVPSGYLRTATQLIGIGVNT